MDIQRRVRRHRTRRILYGVLVLTALALITVGFPQLEPAAPDVDRSTVWIDTVKRGEMVRRVRGPGTLIPESTLWIPAPVEGRVERILIEPGARVDRNTGVVQLSNPQLELEATEAKLELRAAEADYRYLEVGLQSEILDHRARAAKVNADYYEAQLRAEADRELAREGLISNLTQKISETVASETATRHGIEQSRAGMMDKSRDARLMAHQTRIDQLRALHKVRQSQLDSLEVKAGTSGVLQEVLIEVGQEVAAGTNLARVADPRKLKARIRVPETQAKDVQTGQPATIDIRHDLMTGYVLRIDPAVQEGTVTVDIALNGRLPEGTRVDSSIDGTIEIERLNDTLYVGRPVHGQASSAVTVFKLTRRSDEAIRVPVRLGRASVGTIEIVDGLEEGDRVILSDMSEWDRFDRVSLD